MNILSQDHKLYYLQEAWNNLDPEKAITYSHYDLANETDYSTEEWKAFLRDGQIAKYLDDEIELYKQAQMRKLIQKSTTNDKSVGTAQMLNAIGKTMDEDKVENNFFVYSYVPLTPNESVADLVRQEGDWQPPEVIDTSMEETAEPIVDKSTPVQIEQPEEPKHEVDNENWEF